MSQKEITKQNWLTRFIPEFIVRALYKVEDNPEAPEHGASWTSGNGIAPVFSARQSMAVYAKHAYTNACVTRASQDIANLPIKLLRGKGQNTVEIDSHPLLDLFDQPSSNVDGYLFREQFIVDLVMTGNCYTLLVGAENKLTSLYRLHPENVRIIPDPVKMIAGYEYNDGGSTVAYPPERVIHARSASWDINASGELYGTGIVEALNEEITADINAQRMSASVSKQGRPDVLLSPSDPADIWDRRRRQEITQAYKSMTEHGGAMALSGQIQVETLNLSPRDLEFQALREIVRENVSAVTGVPSTVLGLPDANYATARQATITYWEIQQKRARKLEQALTRIAKLVDTDFRVVVDFSNIDALQAVRSEKLDRVVLHIDNGMSPAEAYSYEGLEDSPFTEKKTEESVSESDTVIEEALTSLLTKAKEDELAKIGNMQEAFNELPDRTQKALTRKATEHNEEVNQNKAKKTTKFRLAVVYWRGIGAFKNNPASVRPSVKTPEQWAMARVNSYLYALRNGRYRSGKHDTDLLPADHPMAGDKKSLQEKLDTRQESFLLKDIKGSVGDKDPTNFPEDGKDQQVALRNSDYERFPWQEALDLRENFPEIWGKGGNILGNLQFRRLLPIARRDSSIAQTETEEKAIRLREAWSARHFKDYRLAGVVAQIKWLTVGSRGLAHMRKVISAEKARLAEKKSAPLTKQQKDAHWNKWNTKTLVPALRQLKRASEIYLELASKRYARRASTLKAELEKQAEQKAINYTEILGRASEISSIKKIVGRSYRSIYFLNANDQIDELYRISDRVKPSDFSFDNGDVADRDIDRMARRIVDTSEKQIKRIVRRGVKEGLSNQEISSLIQSATTFSESRADRIAQTETTRAVNTATLEAYKEFEEKEDLQIMKEWISSLDGKVRDTHAELGKSPPIPVREDFEVDGYTADAPANFGEASLDINCRCTIAPVIIE